MIIIRRYREDRRLEAGGEEVREDGTDGKTKASREGNLRGNRKAKHVR